ncbi:MAG: hypothetical protein QOI79_4155 [Mycobacterium sp.]|jgi:hypothetical protein|nr:hypothetical protein [Mycobacterium sp.]
MANPPPRPEGQHQRLIAVRWLIRLPGQRLAAAQRANPAVTPFATLFQQAVSGVVPPPASVLHGMSDGATNSVLAISCTCNGAVSATANTLAGGRSMPVTATDVPIP